MYQALWIGNSNDATLKRIQKSLTKAYGETVEVYGLPEGVGREDFSKILTDISCSSYNIVAFPVTSLITPEFLKVATALKCEVVREIADRHPAGTIVKHRKSGKTVAVFDYESRGWKEVIKITVREAEHSTFYYEKGKRKGMSSTATSEIYTHDEATRILEMFEDVLSRYDIHVPSPEDDDRDPDNMVGLYGSTYSDLLDEVESHLTALLKRHRSDVKIVEGVYSGTK